MNFPEIAERLYEGANPVRAAEMSAYMRHQFSFLGIPKPERKAVLQPFLRAEKHQDKIDWVFVDACYAQSAREFHYIALDYLKALQKALQPADIASLKNLILTHSWWDSVDSIDELVGVLCLKAPDLKPREIRAWSLDTNIWLKRVAIDFQLNYKKQTDVDFLSEVILSNTSTREFFVDKAIGWALRQYARTDPNWVSHFLDRHRDKLSKLSVREASKHL